MRRWPGRGASSSSAAGAFLDRPRTIDALRALAGRLAVRDRRVLRVVLFGSLATGRATIRSDADLLIVLGGHPAPPRERIAEYLDAFREAPVPVDVFPFTVEEMEHRRARGDAFVRRVDAQGVDLLER